MYGVIQSFGKSLTPWRVGAGDKWKKKKGNRERERDRRAVSPTVSLALERLGPYVGSAMYLVTLDRQGQIQIALQGPHFLTLEKWGQCQSRCGNKARRYV